jgi:hypothetical protein
MPFDQASSEFALTEPALMLLALGSLYADFAQLARDSYWDFEMYEAARHPGLSNTLLGMLAERESDTARLISDNDGFDYEDGPEPVFLEALVRARRTTLVERLQSGFGGARMLFLSLLSVAKRRAEFDGYPWREAEDEEPPDPRQLRWDLVPVYVQIEWPCDSESDGYLPARSFVMDIVFPDRLASWIHAGCRWLGPNWEE